MLTNQPLKAQARLIQNQPLKSDFELKNNRLIAL